MEAERTTPAHRPFWGQGRGGQPWKWRTRRATRALRPLSSAGGGSAAATVDAALTPTTRHPPLISQAGRPWREVAPSARAEGNVRAARGETPRHAVRSGALAVTRPHKRGRAALSSVPPRWLRNSAGAPLPLLEVVPGWQLGWSTPPRGRPKGRWLGHRRVSAGPKSRAVWPSLCKARPHLPAGAGQQVSPAGLRSRLCRAARLSDLWA